MSQGQPPRQLEEAEKDLKAAEAEHTRLSGAWQDYAGNPNKYRSILRTAAGRVRFQVPALLSPAAQPVPRQGVPQVVGSGGMLPNARCVTEFSGGSGQNARAYFDGLWALCGRLIRRQRAQVRGNGFIPPFLKKGKEEGRDKLALTRQKIQPHTIQTCTDDQGCDSAGGRV